MDQESRTVLERLGAVAARAGRDTSRDPRLWGLVRVGLTLVVVAFLVAAVATQWDQLREHDLKLDAAWLAPALAALVAVHILGAFGWNLTLRALGHQVNPARAQAIWAKSLLARYVPGSVLTVVSRVVLADAEHVPRRTTMASLAYEQCLMLVSALLVSSWILVGDSRLGTIGVVAMIATALVLLAVMHPRLFAPLANAALRVFGREPLQAVITMRNVLWLTGFYLVLWVVFGIGVYLAARTVLVLPASELPEATAAQAIGYTTSLLLLVFPGGLGVRDGAFALVLDRSIGGGFALAAAIAIAVRLVTTVAEILYAAGAVIVGRRSKTRSLQTFGEAA